MWRVRREGTWRESGISRFKLFIPGIWHRKKEKRTAPGRPGTAVDLPGLACVCGGGGGGGGRYKGRRRKQR